jgi:hypothetical protein
VKQLGIPASALITAATNEPDVSKVGSLQAALRARYDAADWLDVLKPVSDELRGLQRDALVAYVLHQLAGTTAIDTPDKLFEHLLMDVQMDPCMLTSRIRHALSSVQLFIERCVMNLEPRVVQSAINATHWQWMKRYRLWEANRKVFLWPENWLEPELRDDQSPFFKETMSELLQSDITQDRAEMALLNYLSKLEEVAKLEPCGIHYVEDNPDTPDIQDEIAHVVARTGGGANRKYFYRRLEFGSWTPWEQIKLDIEDNPVIPVVWNGRLLLFWLRIVKTSADARPLRRRVIVLKPPVGGSDGGGGNGTGGNGTGDNGNGSNGEGTPTETGQPASSDIRAQAILCWSEYYNGRWQPTKTSEVERPADLGAFAATGPGPRAFDRSKLRLWAFERSEPLRIGISYDNFAAYFSLYNTHSLPVREQPFLVLATSKSRFLDTSSEFLTASYVDPGDRLPGHSAGPPLRLLKNQANLEDFTLEPRHTLEFPSGAPFFYGDTRHLFYVRSAEAPASVLDWHDYGYALRIGNSASTALPLVLGDQIPWSYRRKTQFDPRTAGDPSPVARFLSEDAYISRAIVTTATVRVGDKEIGPSGAVPKSATER